MYLLDATVFVDHVDGVFGASDLVDRLFAETGDIFTCDAVVAEATSKGTDEQVAFIERLVRALEYVSTSPSDALRAGEMRRTRGQSSSRRLGDTLIAAVAASLGATVVTRNPKDFEAYGVPVLAYGQTAD
jgi:predicted nucleic acid-binding protein